jgi:hypothetical protein
MQADNASNAPPLTVTSDSTSLRAHGTTRMYAIYGQIAVTVGYPARYRGVSVYPLSQESKSSTVAYLVLDEALATGQFRITEVSEIGSVPRLLAINDTNSPVFLLDGEELVGAKQNRVLNLSVMLAPKSQTEIPVSCVEAGRWRTTSHAFRAAERVQFARGRAQNCVVCAGADTCCRLKPPSIFGRNYPVRCRPPPYLAARLQLSDLLPRAAGGNGPSQVSGGTTSVPVFWDLSEILDRDF